METRYRYSKVRIAILIIVLFGLIYGIYFGYQKMFGSKDIDPEDLASLVAELALVPAGETPTVSTVTDVANLKMQPFFRDVMIGDKVLVYREAKIAYLFRPSSGKLISISPLAD